MRGVELGVDVELSGVRRNFTCSSMPLLIGVSFGGGRS